MILLRHAQSLFNVSYAVTRIDPGIEDPQLTELGHSQARQAAEVLRSRKIRRIITSPYTRALETTTIINESLGMPVTIDPVVGERAAFVCDIGTESHELAARWPQFDFAHLPKRWWVHQETQEQLLVRCHRFRTAMQAIPDWPDVLVVTHWGFIRGLTGVTVGNSEAIPFDPTAEPIAEPFAGVPTPPGLSKP